MSAEENNVSTEVETPEASGSAPSARAQALRDEIFGSALSLDETAYVLGLDRTTVAKYLRDNVLVGYQIGREWLVPEEELRAYVRRTVEQRRAEAQAGEAMAGAAPDQWNVMEWMRANPFLARTRGLQSRVFDRLTDTARESLALAQQEALRLGHNWMGTEHLLLGLMEASQGRAARVLANLGLDLEQVRSAVEARVGRGLRPADGQVRVSPRLKHVLQAAADEARRLGRRSIDTDDLLLGLLREGEGIAVGILTTLGPGIERLREETRRILEQQRAHLEETPAGTALPPVPSEAATLVAEGETALACETCGARAPAYFRYCFHCGRRLTPAA